MLSLFPPSMSSIACVLIPHLGLQVALLDHPQLDGQPLILGPSVGGHPRVAAANPEATACGIRPGMSLREAMALCPEAITLTPNPAREIHVWERLLCRLDALSPRVEIDQPGIAYIDLRGSARSLGPPDVAACQLLAAVPAVLRPRVGIAPSKFAALAAARTAPPGGSRNVAPAALAAFLAALPVDWLPLPPDQLALLRRLGLDTMGALAALPPATVTARLGPPGRGTWALAGGQPDRDDTIVRPRRRETTVVATLDFAHPTAERDTLLRYVGMLIERVFADESLRNRAVRRATLRATLEDGGSWERSFALKAAMGEERLLDALRLRLGQVELPGVAVTLRLEVAGVTSEATRQARLPGLLPRRRAPLVEAIGSLTARYGGLPIYRIVGVEPWSRIPEHRYALAPYEL